MNGIKNILICNQFSHDSFLTLNQQTFLKVEKCADLGLSDLSQVNGLIIRSQTKIDSLLFSRAKKLEVVITATSGFDHIDLEAAKKWGVAVMHTPEANIESATQLTWSLMLACATKLLAATKSLRAGDWRKPEHSGFELSRKTLGIVGLGRIGRRVAEVAEAFGMSVIAYDPYLEEGIFREVGAERVSYDEILKRSDVLTYHVPKTPETKHMLNRSHFDYISRGIILLNASRGSVICEPDLCQALENGWLGAVGLDVFEKEPLNRDSKLLTYPNVVLTPHIGAATTEAFAKASEQAALKLIRFFMDGSTSDTLPPKAAWYGATPPWKSLD